jgi:hypothetical protein
MQQLGMRPNMNAIEEKYLDDRGGASASAAPVAARMRIEPMDNWHSAWPRLLKFVEKHGDPRKLQVDGDGWLSARQVLLVAHVGDQIAGYVCFSVVPGKTCIEARHDHYAIAPKFAGRDIESKLHRAAVARAASLGCEKLKGFKLPAKGTRARK